MGVEARASSAEGRTYLRALKHEAAAVLRVLGIGNFELSLLLCDDAIIRRLNRDYRHKDKPTDVLSFAQEDDAGGVAGRLCRAAAIPPAAAKHRGAGEAVAAAPPPPPLLLLLGDVVISYPTAERQAHALGQNPRERLRTLMIHGVLHLLGYDHERSPAEARRMFARERAIAAALDGRTEAASGSTRRNQSGVMTVLKDGPHPSRSKAASVASPARGHPR